MNNFDQAFIDLLHNEGGYSNDAHDSGGETMWGITKAVAASCGYTLPMADMPQNTAKTIYKELYWANWFDDLPYPVAFALFDTSVNSGPAQAARILQRTLMVPVDGKVGPVTLAAAKAIDPVKLTILYNAARLEFYTSLGNWQHFGKGWTLRVVNNMRKGVL